MVAAFEEVAEAEGTTKSAAASDFASGLDRVLDDLTSALEEDEASGALLPDDTVYRTFTLSENLTGLAERHVRQRGTTDALRLIQVVQESKVEIYT